MKIGIVICDRYNQCDGGKCFRAVRNREGAFRRYSQEEELEVVSYTTCGGCPGGNIENAVLGMKKYGAQAIHFATGFLAGYPPCLYLKTLKDYTEEITNLPVIVGTHPMPTNYIRTHQKLEDWNDMHNRMMKEFDMIDTIESAKYDSSTADYQKKLTQELHE